MASQAATEMRRERDEVHEQELRAQQERLTQEAADASEKERVQRHEALDEV